MNNDKPNNVYDDIIESSLKKAAIAMFVVLLIFAVFVTIYTLTP